MPAFEHALRLGVDVLELDMAVTRDGHIVVSHDPYISPKICRHWDGKPLASPVAIHTLTLKQVQSYDCGAIRNPDFPKQIPVPHTAPPTLEQVFALAAAYPKAEFNIETKIFAKEPQLSPGPEEFARLVVEAVSRHGLEERVMVQSFDPRTLREVRKIAPRIRLSVLSEDGVGYIELARDLGAEIVSPRYTALKPQDVVRAHELAMQVVPWTANDEAAWKSLVAMGVDAIISDDPEALARFLGRRKP